MMNDRTMQVSGMKMLAGLALLAVLMTGVALPAQAQLERVVADAKGIT